MCVCVCCSGIEIASVTSSRTVCHAHSHAHTCTRTPLDTGLCRQQAAHCTHSQRHSLDAAAALGIPSNAIEKSYRSGFITIFAFAFELLQHEQQQYSTGDRQEKKRFPYTHGPMLSLCSPNAIVLACLLCIHNVQSILLICLQPNITITTTTTTTAI